MKRRKKSSDVRENPLVVRTWAQVADEYSARTGERISDMGALKVCRRATEKIRAILDPPPHGARARKEGNMKPVRIQRSRKRGSKLESPNGLPVVCVGRPGKWGNTYVVGQTGYVPGQQRVIVRDAAHAVELYRRNVRDIVAGALFRRTVQDELRGKNLACWCPIGAPCHADVLLEIANA